MSKTLLIDMDCILVDMIPPWLARYNEITESDIKLSDIVEYDMGLVCTNEKVLYAILNEPGFFLDMPAMPGAVPALKALVADGYDIVILTQPPEDAAQGISEKQQWIKDRFPDFKLKNMMFGSRKELVGGDLLFDDRPAHLESWAERHPDGKLATLDWDYNKGAKAHFRGALDGSGWVNFVEFVREVLPLK